MISFTAVAPGFSCGSRLNGLDVVFVGGGWEGWTLGLAIKPRRTAVGRQSAEPQLIASRELIYTSCDRDLGTAQAKQAPSPESLTQINAPLCDARATLFLHSLVFSL